jgi:proline dehydrogenase
MLKQYRILTSCLSELKKSDIQTMEKLKLEVQLIQAKRVLLEYEVEHRISGVEASEAEFHDLYDHIKKVCSSNCANDEIGRVASRLQKIIGELRSNAYMVKKDAENRWHRFILRSVFGRYMF